MVLLSEITFHLLDFVAERGSVKLQNFALRSWTMAHYADERNQRDSGGGVLSPPRTDTEWGLCRPPFRLQSDLVVV